MKSNMLKCLVVLMFCVSYMTCIICGCTPSNEDISKEYFMPQELQEYKVVVLRCSYAPDLYVLAKKNGEDREVIGTTSPQGKIQVHTIVINGNEYVPKGVNNPDNDSAP